MCELLWFGIAESSVMYIAKKEGSRKPLKATLMSVTVTEWNKLNPDIKILIPMQSSVKSF